MTNFTVIDLGKVIVGLVLFIPFALSPGYVLGWLSGVLEFRRRSVGEQTLLALVLSVATAPVLIYLSARLASMALAWALIGAGFAAFLILFIRGLARESRPYSIYYRPLLVGLFWVAIGLASMVDFHWKDRLYIAASTFDYAVRNQIVESIIRTGVRPWNPFFFPGHAVPLRYHFFWYLPCSMVGELSRGWVGPGPAIIAGTIWCGLGLIALVPVYVWYFRPTEAALSRRRAWTGIALLGVIGLDIFPVLLLLSVGIWVFEIGKWNEEIDGWLVSLIWAPHYVAALIGGLTGFLVLWRSASQNIGARVAAVVVAGVAFAGLTGTAIYIAFVFAAAIGAFAVVALWKRWWRDALGIAVSGVIAGILAIPYLSDLLLSGGSNSGPGQAFIVPTVRRFNMLDAILVALNIGWKRVAAVNLFLLPVNYLLELGLFFVVGVAQTRRFAKRKAPLGRKEWAEVILIAVPILICTFFRSSAIENNDLGWRGFLIPQFVLLLWAIDYVRVALRTMSKRREELSEGMRRLRNWVLVTMWIGVTGTVAAFVINRVFTPVFDMGWNHERNWIIPDQVSGARVLGLRETYQWLDRRAAPDAIILRSPEFPDVSYGLFSNRRTVAADAGCGTSFGGSMDECRKVFPLVMPLFAANASQDRSQIKALCDGYSVAFIVVKDIDPVWRNPQSWVWERKPIYSNDFSRVFECSD